MNSSLVAFNQVLKKRIRFRYETAGRWYKGSIHLHTVSSDGHLTLEELVQKYSEEKFDFISITDHWCFPQLNGDRQALPLLVINGVELDGYDNLGTYYHVLAIGASLKPALLTGNFLKTLRIAYSQGAVLIWAHPYWTGNSIQEGLRHKFHGLEIYNHSSQCENGSGYALSHWDGMLNHNPDFLGALFRVWGSSDFVAHSCISHPEILSGLLESGDLLADYVRTARYPPRGLTRAIFAWARRSSSVGSSAPGCVHSVRSRTW